MNGEPFIKGRLSFVNLLPDWGWDLKCGWVANGGMSDSYCGVSWSNWITDSSNPELSGANYILSSSNSFG